VSVPDARAGIVWSRRMADSGMQQPKIADLEREEESERPDNALGKPLLLMP